MSLRGLVIANRIMAALNFLFAVTGIVLLVYFHKWEAMWTPFFNVLCGLMALDAARKAAGHGRLRPTDPKNYREFDQAVRANERRVKERMLR